MPDSGEPKIDQPNTGETGDVSAKLRVIFRRKRRLALARQRHKNRCSLSVLLRVMLYVYRRVHRRLMHLFVSGLVGVNLVRMLHRRADVVEPLE